MQSAQRFAAGIPGAVVVGWRTTSQGERVVVEVPDEPARARNRKRREIIQKIDDILSRL